MNENIEKVLAMLDGFRMSDEMTYSAYSTLHDEISLLDDLLKEQEAVKPNIVDTALPVNKTAVYFVKTYWCGACGEAINQSYVYCRKCGRAVKWE